MKKNKVIRLNGDNYSELLHEFSDSFLNDFPEDYDTWEILDFSMESWNIANLKRLVPVNEFMDTMNSSYEMKEDSELFKKMIEHKEKYYSEFNKFILDFALDIEEESPKLEVLLGDFHDYKMFLEESEDDVYEELEENIVNRNAIILKPKKPFVDWVKKVDEEDDDEAFILETKIYLVDDEVEPEDWLEDNFYDLFERELEEWSIDDDLWPQNLSFTMFKKWFKVDFSIMVYDMENKEISKDII